MTERYSPEVSTCRVVLYGNVNLINAIYEGLFSVNVSGADIIKILGYYKVETGRRLVSGYAAPQVAVFFFCRVPFNVLQNFTFFWEVCYTRCMKTIGFLVL